VHKGCSIALFLTISIATATTITTITTTITITIAITIAITAIAIIAKFIVRESSITDVTIPGASLVHSLL
jgi:hypothetical protein